MVGLIWTIQLVHYPMFRHIAKESFPEAEKDHCRRIGWIVAPSMLCEAVSVVPLLLFQSGFAERLAQFIGLVLLFMIWASTYWVQVPLHRSLSQGKESNDLERLIRSNWMRTVGWTARGCVVLVLLWFACA
jgi:hypothetical protein